MEQILIKPIWKCQITIPWVWRKTLGITKDTYIKATLTDKGVFIQNANINFNEIDDELALDEAIKSSIIKSKLEILASKL